MDKLSPAEEETRQMLEMASQSKSIIEFGPKIGADNDAYAEPGMRARMTSFQYHPRYECFVIDVDFTEFDDYNRGFESSSWQINGHNVTARECGNYNMQDSIYFHIKSIDEKFKLVDVPRLYLKEVKERFMADTGGQGSYVAWLEDIAASALGIKENVQPEESISPRTP